jgi:hypothetical protein
LNDHLDFLREFFVDKNPPPHRERTTWARVRDRLSGIAFVVVSIGLVFFGHSLLVRAIVVGSVIFVFLRSIVTLLYRWYRHATK